MKKPWPWQWMIFEQTRLEPNISPARFFTTILPARKMEMAAQIAAWQEKGRNGLARLDHHLGHQDFVAGDRYTIADIAVYGYTHVADEGGFDLSAYPAVGNWLSRVRQAKGHIAMPAFAAAAA